MIDRMMSLTSAADTYIVGCKACIGDMKGKNPQRKMDHIQSTFDLSHLIVMRRSKLWTSLASLGYLKS